MKKIKIIFFTLLVAGSAGLASCGGGNNNTTDSASVNTTDTSSVTPLGDTAPSAEMPPGAVNPGEDSSRYGTGTGDSSRNRGPQ